VRAPASARQILRVIDQQVIDQVRDRILAACHPEAIVLFGSAAREEAVLGSDLDLLIVIDLPTDVSPRDMARELHAIFRGWLLPLDIIVLTPAEWEQGLRLPGHIARVAAQEGVRLYG
jgi:predicted nucleotidyltransferase